MGVRRLVLLLAAAALAACSEQRESESVTGPQFKPTPDACDFNALNSLITGYFPTANGPQSRALSLKQAMATATARTSGAIDAGFEIMDSIGAVSRYAAGNVSPTAGAQLTMGLIPCMFDQSTITYPDGTPLADFTNALTSATGGAYYVRGGHDLGRSADVLGTTDPDDPQANISGVEPVSGSTWVQVLSSGNAVSNGQALIYGYPVPTQPGVFEWATVPSEAKFQVPSSTSPGAIVSVCDNDQNLAAMVHETNIGVLAFASTSLCSGERSLTMAPGSGSLLARVAQTIRSAFTPTPLHATALGNYGTGGTASTFKSKFSKKSVSSLVLAYVANQPPATPTANTTFAVAVTVSAVEGTDTLPVLGTCVYLTGTNNNGQPTAVNGPVEEQCNAIRPAGIPDSAPSKITESFLTTKSKADYGKTIVVTKSGGLILTATAKVIQRSGNGSAFTKLNVKPAK